MVSSLMIFHAVISVLLIVSVLAQFGKGAEAGLLGGGASEAVFTGAQQGNILQKVTIVLSILFIGNCLLLAKIQSGKESKSLLQGETPIAAPLNSDQPKAMGTTPAQPAKPAAPKAK